MKLGVYQGKETNRYYWTVGVNISNDNTQSTHYISTKAPGDSFGHPRWEQLLFKNFHRYNRQL